MVRLTFQTYYKFKGQECINNRYYYSKNEFKFIIAELC